MTGRPDLLSHHECGGAVLIMFDPNWIQLVEPEALMSILTQVQRLTRIAHLIADVLGAELHLECKAAGLTPRAVRSFPQTPNRFCSSMLRMPGQRYMLCHFQAAVTTTLCATASATVSVDACEGHYAYLLGLGSSLHAILCCG